MKPRFYEVMFMMAWELFKKAYRPLINLLVILGVLWVVMCWSNYVFSQQTIPFTPEEVETIARHNLERKKCLELNEINEREIDSLNLKVNLLEDQIDLKDTTIANFRSLVSNYEKIDSLRVEQNKELLEDTKEQEKIIKKQKRRLNFWRIFTPITLTATAILGLFI